MIVDYRAFSEGLQRGLFMGRIGSGVFVHQVWKGIMKKLKLFEVVEISFYDPSSDYGWKVNGEIVSAPILCKAIGYYLAKNKSYITICSLRHSDGTSIADCFSVPLGCIHSIKRLGKVKNGRA